MSKMIAFEGEVPSWIKLLITLGATLITVTLAYGQLKTEDTAIHGRINTVEFKQETSDQKFDETLQLLREEIERHHPRK